MPSNVTSGVTRGVLSGVIRGEAAAEPFTAVFLVAGQSNSTSRADFDDGDDWPSGVQQLERWTDGIKSDEMPTDHPVDENTAAAATLIAASRPLHHRRRTPTGGMGLALQFVIDYKAANPSASIVLVPAGQGSTGIYNGDWEPEGFNYADAVDRANRAMELNPDAVFAGILWNQGERDTSPTAAADEYAANLAAVADGMRRDIDAASNDTPFICAEMNRNYVGSDTDRQTVQAALNDLPNQRYYTATVSAESVALDDADPVHHDSAGYRTLGTRYNTALVTAAANVAPAFPAAESGANGHWVFGGDNPRMEGLVGGRMVYNGVVPPNGDGFAKILFGTARGLVSPIEDSANIAMMGVIRVPNLQARIFGTPPSTSDSQFLFRGTSNFRHNAQVGGSNQITSSTSIPTVWAFVGVSMSAAGDRRLYVRSGGASEVVEDTVTRTVNTTDTINIGPVSDNNAQFDNPFDIAEFITFDAHQSEADFDAIYSRAVTRMLARGVIIGS